MSNGSVAAVIALNRKGGEFLTLTPRTFGPGEREKFTPGLGGCDAPEMDITGTPNGY